METLDSIPEFYKNRDVLITGVTGFVGKVLLEKLLRCCDVNRIFILVRSKRGMEPEERRKEILRSVLFNKIKEERPYMLERVHCIQGNTIEEKLGMTPTDIETITKSVSIVFHLAASVNFDESLRSSFSNNVLSTKRLAEICSKMRHLVAFVHVSTAYCNCQKTETHERVYPMATDFDSFLNILQSKDDDAIKEMMPTLLDGRPNTYTLTKAIAENMLTKYYQDLPIVIVRPSIVSAAWKEPYPGWCDSVNGANGLIAAAMKGILRTMLVHGEKVTDFIPVDILVNLLLTVAWNKPQERTKEIQVYHSTSGTINPLTWNGMMSSLYPLVWEYPSRKIFIFPAGGYKRSHTWNQICILLEHQLPAALTDLYLFLSGKKPKLMYIYKKLHKAISKLEYFSTREWIFHTKNCQLLLEKMPENDKEKFSFDISELKWFIYMKNYVVGTRRYLFKEDDSTLPEARWNIQKKYLIAMTIQTGLFLGITHYITSNFIVNRFIA